MKTMKKLLSLCLALCLVLGLATTAFAADENPTPFTDLTSNWYMEAVAYVYENKLMNGTDGETFAPKGSVNRAMVVTVLHREAGLPEAKDAESAFNDIVAGKYYYDAVLWAEETGVTKGKNTDTTFVPNGAVTREEVATFLYRYAEIMEYDTTASAELSFPDADKVHNYAKEAMSWAVGAGIINGNADGTLNPRGEATRAELAVMLMRFCENIANAKEEEPSETPSTEPTEPAGSESNPIHINPEEENVADLDKGETVYYYGNLFEMIMTINQADNATVTYDGKEYKAEDGVITIEFPSGSPFNPIEFSITSVADAKYEMTFEYPVGHMMNPEVVDITGEYTAVIEKDDPDGYFYTYTASEAGTLSVEVSATTGWSFNVNNMTTGKYGDAQYSDDKNAVNPYELEVAAGDEIQVVVTTYDAKKPYNAPAGEVKVEYTFTAVPGTENNPYVIKVDTSEDVYEYETVKLAKGSVTYFVAEDHERRVVSIENAKDLVVKCGGTEYKPVNGTITIPLNTNQPATLEVTNNGAEAAYEIAFVYSEGTAKNPISLGNEETFAETVEYTMQDEHGIYYVWTAPADGILTAAYTVPENSGATITVELNGDDELEIPVLKGDKVEVFVKAANASGLPVAVEFDITGEMSGTANNPLSAFLYQMGMNISTFLEVPAGATYYYVVEGNVNGMNMVIQNAKNVAVTYNGVVSEPEDGTLTVEGLSCNLSFQIFPVIGVSNSGEEDAAYTARFAFPLGHLENPEIIEISSEDTVKVEASVEAGDYDGYAYAVMSSKDGILYVNVPNGCCISVTNSDGLQKTEEDAVDGVIGIPVASYEEVILIFSAQVNNKGEYPACEAELVLELNTDRVVAEVNNVYYADWAAAVAAAKSSKGTIKLMGDITSADRVLTVANGETISLNMNGRTISSSYDPYTIQVEQGGTLTIIGNGLIENTSAGSTTIDNYGTLTIGGEWKYGPKITRGETTNGAGNSAVKCEEDSVLTIYDGTFGGDKRSIQSWGTTTIYGGIFEKTVEVWQWDDTADSGKVYKSKMTINGGTFEGDVTVRSDENAETDDKGELIIYGGSFDSFSVPLYACVPQGYNAVQGEEYYTVSKNGSCEENPIVLQSDTTVSLEAWESTYFRVLFGGMTMVIEDANNLTVNFEGTSYSADENGKIEVELPAFRFGFGEHSFSIFAYSKCEVALKFVPSATEG